MKFIPLLPIFIFSACASNHQRSVASEEDPAVVAVASNFQSKTIVSSVLNNIHQTSLDTWGRLSISGRIQIDDFGNDSEESLIGFVKGNVREAIGTLQGKGVLVKDANVACSSRRRPPRDLICSGSLDFK